MEFEIVYVDVSELQPGMLLAENIYDLEGNILLAGGIKLRENYIRKIEETPTLKVAIHKEGHVVLDGSGTPSKTVPLTPQQKKQQRIERTREDARATLQRALSNLVDKDFANMGMIADVVERLLNDILSSDDIVFHIDQLRDTDAYLFDHGINVAILSIVVGIISGMSRSALKDLATGAILHDIGKLFLDQNVLNKPGPLSPEEFSLAKHHSRLGYEVMKKFPEITQEAAIISLNHHERFDGSGYPMGISGDSIGVFSEIVGLVDVFDAMTSDRVYAKKVSPYKAVQVLLKGSETLFNPVIVNRFIGAVGYYYHGAVVKLQNEAIGVVIERDRYRPVVRVIQDANGNTVLDHFEIDLKKNPTMRIKSILSESQSAALPYYTNKRTGIS